MEPAGLVLGVIPLLVKSCMEGYNFLQDMMEFGSDYSSFLLELEAERLRLRRWVNAQGLGDSSHAEKRLSPADDRYRYAMGTLAQLMAVFASIEDLHARYGIAVDTQPPPSAGTPSPLLTQGSKSQQSQVRHISWFQKIPQTLKRMPLMRTSKSRPGSNPSASASASQSQPAPAQSSVQPVQALSAQDLQLLQNPRTLLDKSVLPGLEQDIMTLKEAAKTFQTQLSLYRKMRWGVVDKEKLGKLIEQLRKYNTGLKDVFPEDTVQISNRHGNSEDQGVSFKIPFEFKFQHTNFVGREYLTTKLKAGLRERSDRMNVVVVYGLGGIGKTQLAIEYAYNSIQDYTSIFWIAAASEEEIKHSFVEAANRLIQHHAGLITTINHTPDFPLIARKLGLQGGLDQNGSILTEPGVLQKVVQAVRRWFAATENRDWLIIFDNYDDVDSFDINAYIPTCDHGAAIITSRRPDCAQGRIGLQVNVMNEAEAIQLLLESTMLRTTTAPKDTSEARVIVKDLGYLPLALEQAGAYIRAQQLTLGAYLDKYHEEFTHIIQKDWTQWGYGRSIVATWEISFEAIRRQRSEAAELLLLCGFLANDDIFEEMFRRGLKPPSDESSLSGSLGVLFSYSMAKRNGNDSVYIHPLVHLWAQERLSKQQKEAKTQEALLFIASSFVHPEKKTSEDWAFERRMMPHMNAIAKHIERYPEIHTHEVINAMYRLGIVYFDQRRLSEARAMLERVFAWEGKLLGLDHYDTISTVHNMANTYREQGEYTKALEWFQRALVGYEKSLGMDHPNTFGAVHGMANTYWQQGEYTKALEWFQRALVGYEKSLGMDHPNTLGAVHGMANTYREQGEYTKALEWFQRALVGYEKSLGLDHPDTLNAVHNMALVYQEQGEYAKALELYQQALAGYESRLGRAHPYTQTAFSNLSKLLKRLGNNKELAKLKERFAITTLPIAT